MNVEAMYSLLFQISIHRSNQIIRIWLQWHTINRWYILWSISHSQTISSCIPYSITLCLQCNNRLNPSNHIQWSRWNTSLWQNWMVYNSIYYPWIIWFIHIKQWHNHSFDQYRSDTLYWYFHCNYSWFNIVRFGMFW